VTEAGLPVRAVVPFGLRNAREIGAKKDLGAGLVGGSASPSRGGWLVWFWRGCGCREATGLRTPNGAAAP
jgi:hypothetical protein